MLHTVTITELVTYKLDIEAPDAETAEQLTRQAWDTQDWPNDQPPTYMGASDLTLTT